MSPAADKMDLWPQIHAKCPDIKFQLVPYVNSEENAREILANLGRRIDVVAGIFNRCENGNEVLMAIGCYRANSGDKLKKKRSHNK